MKNKPHLKTNPRSGKISRPRPPILRFTPTAWAKLLFLRDAGPTEVGGFGIAATADPLLVTDVVPVDQHCSSISVAFDDAAVARFFDDQVDQGLHPAQFGRTWIHTHPGHCPRPSLTDEETFARVFGHTDWAVMFILAQEGQAYCRLQYHLGPGAAAELAVEVDYRQPFGESDHPSWEAEYRAKVHERVSLGVALDRSTSKPRRDQDLDEPVPARRTPALALGGSDDDYPFFREEDWHDLYQGYE